MGGVAEKDCNLDRVKIKGDCYYCISSVDAMRPFFMNIVSDANHWLFIASNGGITAGRRSADHALFPYYTVDKIIESVENTGSKSIFVINRKDKKHIWEPFSVRNSALFKTTRNLYKGIYGNKILFEEVNHDLELSFQYEWNTSNLFGFVRKCRLYNLSKQSQEISILDGLNNVLPAGVGSFLQNQSSNLVDAYKRCELLEESGIGIFGLSAIIVDKAEPSEALKANIVWSVGLDNPVHLLSAMQLDRVRKQQPVSRESDIKGERGGYFVFDNTKLAGESIKEWIIVADVDISVSSIVKLSHEIQNDNNLEARILSDIDKGTNNLLALNSSADAMQLSNDQLKDTRHFSNTLFNISRGGVFDNNYQIERDDFIDYLFLANRDVAKSTTAILEELPKVFNLDKLKEVSDETSNIDFKRLSVEYLPIRFSRRHGDPSRPWNQFTINTVNENDGSKIIDYEGNWRDIFQNWEAMVHSFPGFVEGMLTRFLNASTFDGYNPYRITKNGIDWERIEPDDPWSYIGYWGDHQIIYMLKFLEFSESRYPGLLHDYFDKDLFVYANVPYRIKRYDEILLNPKDTIIFDNKLDEVISLKSSDLGTDSAILCNKKNEFVRANFVEKILATVLAKMSNFIPEGGIWLNTQRPEWNDANNALVGNGMSMVTLYYLFRFFNLIDKMFRKYTKRSVRVSKETLLFLNDTIDVLEKYRNTLSGPVGDGLRKKILDGLGQAGSSYREIIYDKSFSGRKEEVKISTLLNFTTLCLEYFSHSIEANKRDDNLFHAYNIMSLVGNDEISISYLDEMLEGQVAILSSGYLNSSEVLKLLDALRSSRLYRDDQSSYMLYPEKEIPGFMSKNNIQVELVESSGLLTTLLKRKESSILEKDVNGDYHFNENLRNSNDLKKAIEKLDKSVYGDLINSDTQLLLSIFEKVFNHKSFTGRSGTFFGYEGIGSIYWHMVSKLALAVLESCLKAIENNTDRQLVDKLVEYYYQIREGLGIHKPPMLYGGFPTDPYSHTPAGKGVRQPGMTGQVKEDILCRFKELGIIVHEGKLGFDPSVLRLKEFLPASGTFTYYDVNNTLNSLEIKPGSIAFTYCQVPVIYSLDETDKIELILNNDEPVQLDSNFLNLQYSKDIFNRNDKIKRILVYIKKNKLIK